MFHIVQSNQSFEATSEALAAAVTKHKFGVLHIHNIAETLRSKGIAFTQQCHVFEVCNPTFASRVLEIDMRINMALPCRISVYTEDGKTWVGMIPPSTLLANLSNDHRLTAVADEVEATMMQMIAEATSSDRA